MYIYIVHVHLHGHSCTCIKAKVEYSILKSAAYENSAFITGQNHTAHLLGGHCTHMHSGLSMYTVELPPNSKIPVPFILYMDKSNPLLININSVRLLFKKCSQLASWVEQFMYVDTSGTTGVRLSVKSG